jgi:hypothetical protein
VEVRVVIRELLDVIFNKAVDVPLEHRAVEVKPEFLSSVFVNPSRQRGTTKGVDAQQFELALVKVVKTVAGKLMVNGDDRSRHCSWGRKFLKWLDV